MLYGAGDDNFFSIPGGLDTDEPWQGRWEGGVLVECHGEQERKGQDKTDDKRRDGHRTRWTTNKNHTLQFLSYNYLYHLFTLIRAAKNYGI